MLVISKTDLAREIGFSAARISQFIKAGMPVRSDGKLDRAAALKWLDLNQPGFKDHGLKRAPRRKRAAQQTQPVPEAHSSQPGEPSEPAGGPIEDPAFDLDDPNLPLAQAAQRKENYLGLKHRQDFQRRRGEVVDRAAANAEFFEKAREFRDSWLAWPARVAISMAEDLRVDPVTGKVDYRILTTVLTAHVRQHLAEMGEPEEPEWKAADTSASGGGRR